jgi:hypothetical protein
MILFLMIGFGFNSKFNMVSFSGTIYYTLDVELAPETTGHIRIYSNDVNITPSCTLGDYGYGYVIISGQTELGNTITAKVVYNGVTYTSPFSYVVENEQGFNDWGTTTPNFTLPPNSCSDVIACNYGFQQECDYSLISDGTLDCNYNILTITHFISIIMNDLIPTYQESLSLDLNQDNVLNVVDIVLIVDYILD